MLALLYPFTVFSSRLSALFPLKVSGQEIFEIFKISEFDALTVGFCFSNN
jgi:hypothetical protein